jgi:hypothetical protein
MGLLTYMKSSFVFATLFLLIVLVALPVVATEQPSAEPETAFLSPSQYTNGFFGFSLSLPTDPPFQEASFSSLPSPPGHVLLFLQAMTVSFNYKPRLTMLMISAKESEDSSSDAIRNAVTGQQSAQPQAVEIAGKQFWRAAWEEKSEFGPAHYVKFATAAHGYILTFLITSFDGRLAGHLERNVERIRFFDPVKAPEVAGATSKPYKPGSRPSITPLTPSHIGQLNVGVTSGNTFTNDTLGFSFQFPAGWVLADKGTQESVIKAGHQLAWGNDPAATREHNVVEQRSKTLLWANKYPEGTKTDEINPLIMIVAFDSDCLPGVALPTSIEDSDAIRRVGAQISGALSGTPFIGSGRNSLRAFMRQNRLMLDLSSAVKVEVPNRKEPRDVFTSIIFTEDNDYWVVWTFMDGSQLGINELRKDVKITFTPSVPRTEQK